MKIKKLLKLLLSVFLVVILTGIASLSTSAPPVPQKGEPINLSFAWYQAGTMSESMALEKHVKEVEKRTQGKVKITCYPGGTLADARGIMDAVGKGVCSMGESIAAYTPGRCPLHSGLELPFGFTSSLMASRISWEIAKKYNMEEFQAQRIHLLFAWTTLPTCIQSKKPIRSLEDLKGLQVRCPSGQVAVYKALGAVPVSMPITESFMALQKGVVDAQSLPFDSAMEWGMADVTKYWVEVNHSITVLWVGMNIDIWKSLPSDVKKVFDELGTYGSELLATTWDNNLPKSIKDAKAKGIEFVKLSPEELSRWETRYATVIEAWIKDMEAKGKSARPMINEIQGLIKKYPGMYK